MAKQTYNVIGVMSGTSLDGVDIAYCSFTKSDSTNTNTWSFTIHNAETVPYDSTRRTILKNAVHSSKIELQALDKTYSKFLAGVINSFISKHSIKELDFVASHGHTVWHRPDLGYTYQIGNRQEVADLCGVKIICDFRDQDVKFGGQGAPLVPIGDKFLFHNYDYCLNIGGFANVSFQVENKRIAFDICPANLVLNYFVSEFNLEFDDRGRLASSGAIDKALLEDLNSITYYQKPPPKSLGLEWVHEVFFPLINIRSIKTEDVLRTIVEHIAIQISRVIDKKNTKVLITGGGAHNDFLISRIRYFSKAAVVIPKPTVVNFKEALVFAFLGVLKERNENNCLKSVTGAKRDHSSGIVFFPQRKINN